ncbi:MAG: hypothetical protein IPK60_00960 [Sandaracinaceae bacterium]|nr:hypothetical protein [Sandaracinaceae bacterium]
MRLKIIAGNLIAVLLLGLVSFAVVRSQLTTKLTADVDAKINTDRQLLDRSWRLSNLEFVQQVDERARTREMSDALAAGSNTRTARAFQAAESTAAWFRDPSRRGALPDVVFITDETGAVIVRNADINRNHGLALGQSLPSVRTALATGTAQVDVWTKTDEDKVMQTAIAPIRNDQSVVVGALVVGFDISNGYAQREAGVLGRDVAFLIAGKVYSSSLETERSTALRAFLFGGPGNAAATAALAANGGDPQPWEATLGGDTYIGVTGHLANSTATPAAFVVLGNRSAATEKVSVTNIILLLTLLFTILVLVYGFVVGGALEKPIEEIEEGVLAVINGRHDLRLDIESAELGGLAYRINQLLNVFTGVQETSDDSSGGDDGADWNDKAFADPVGGGASGGNEAVDDPAMAAQLAAEPEAAYFARVYREYVAAKQANGENVSNIPQDKFIQRLKGNEEALVKKHACKMVRFKVETRGSQVILRPVIIR